MAKRERDPLRRLHKDIGAIERETRASATTKLVNYALRRNTDSNDRLDGLFETATARLLDLIENKKITEQQIVATVARLGDLDPATVSASDAGLADAKIAAYAALQPGEPIVHAYSQDTLHPVTGIIANDPLEVSVKALKRSRSPNDPYQPHRAPVATIKVPLRTNPRAKEEIKHVNLPFSSLPERLIGREALQRFIIDDIKLAPSATSHPSILQDLPGLRDEIVKLQQLGMEPVDMTELDLRIKEQQQLSGIVDRFSSVIRWRPRRNR